MAWKYGNLRNFSGWAEWKIFFAGLYSEGYFKHHQDQLFHAARNVCWSNICILWRLYLLVFAFWFAVDILVLNYGRIRAFRFCVSTSNRQPFSEFPRLSPGLPSGMFTYPQCLHPKRMLW